jgi:hypothetical protein
VREVVVTFQDESVQRFAIDRPDLVAVFDRAHGGEYAAQRVVRQLVAERYRAAKVHAVRLVRDRRFAVEI